ncbi:MAG: hypothetical protein ATN34_04600 [Epulopiscium sp. Nele67-Bin002]|nr:MAG: hypothetical protein ATN34_04600 [Epulopiscium sp. Nele67-Bin002]
MEYTITHAQLYHKPKIIKFLHDYWGSQHCIVTSDELFTYQYIIDNSLNFIIAQDENNEIGALVGYIKYKKTDSPILAAMWVKNPKIKDQLIGLRVLEHLKTLGSSLSCVGIHPRTRPAYEFINCHTGQMEHYYRLNEQMTHYTIPQINNKTILPIKKHDTSTLTQIQTISELQYNQIQQDGLQKDLNYIKYRYINYPFYDYKIYSITAEKKVISLLILRIIPIKTANVIRIIDFIGQQKYLGTVSKQLNQLLQHYNAEYMDFYEHGIQQQTLNDIGFINNDYTNIIPNYFEPYVLSNVKLYYASDTNACLFKGDADQDRPNIILIKK